ncbi:SEC-C metal-binding domain-containing protein [Nocardia pseudovaccinii]|uniref:SEC-C metal-binding domain-containing protein n=1 Tax=Nocardia pseudovaccinii TaxID=189540 RepID=UPI0007A428F5|nr:SEC-C metal-binding domain-containing protein [Nocardia pseudovaccinii]
MVGQADAERAEYAALLAEQARLLAERDRLRDEFADRFADFCESPEEAARQLEQEAADNPAERAQYLTEAADHWVMADNPERALRLHRAAVADGGTVVGDARVWYATFLIDHGTDLTDNAEQTGLALLETVFAEGTDDHVAYLTAAEMFEERREFDAAMRWLEAGLARQLALADDTDSEPYLGLQELAMTRSRIRDALGLPEDSIDRVAEEGRQWWLDQGTGGHYGTAHPSATSVLYWPESEFAAALKRWPALREQYETHEEHRGLVERTLRGLPSAARIAAATVAGLIDYAESISADPALAQTRAEYAAVLAETGNVVVWPRGRNEPCWCGSGRKYKKCCGRPIND